MTCDEVRRHWNLYHDSEGDAELHFRIGEHLAMCPECAQWFDEESRLEHLIVDKLRSVPETPELWDRVLARSGLTPPSPARRWMILVGIAACAASAAVVWFGAAALFPPSKEADLAELAALWHQRLVDGRVEVPFRSRSDAEVERYLKTRVSFPVRCPPRQDAGFAVRGTGICALADRPAAYLLGQVGDAPVSIFVLPSDSLDTFPHERDSIRREGTHHCRQDPYEMVASVIDHNVVLVIGRAEPNRLLKVLNAYGTYHDHPRETARDHHSA
jgi:hypothetical protein